MDNRFVILCCENIRPEVDAVLAEGDMPDAVAESFPFHCGHVRSAWDSIKEPFRRLGENGSGTCILGCGCSNTLDIPPDIRSGPSLVLAEAGASLFLPGSLAEHYHRSGAYLILPGWLIHWKGNAECDGLDHSTAREMFGESLSEILLLDTGVRPDLGPVLAEFADFTGLPARTVPAGIELFRCRLQAEYRKWECTRKTIACRAAVSAAEKRVADYSMVADLIGKLIGAHDERAIIRQMLDLIILLFSPKSTGFLPFSEGEPGAIISIPQEAYPSADHFQRNADPLHPYDTEGDGDSFTHQVWYNENLIGILSVDGISIPEALDEYLNLTHFIARIAGLSITIARTHQDLVKTIAERDDEIEERTQIQEELSLRSEILQNMAEGVALIRTDDGTIVFVNPRFSRMFGYGNGELLEKNVAILNAPDTRSGAEIARGIESELRQNGTWTGEIKNIRKDGSVFWCRAIVSTYNHPAFGRVWITVHEDITERKLIENALAGTEQRFRQLYEGMRDAYASIDMDGHITGFNPAFAAIIGYPPDAIYALSLDDITPERWREKEQDVISTQVLTRGYSDIYEKEYRRRDGSLVPVELRTNLIRGEDDQPQGMWAIVRDITQRKESERALAESERRYRTIIENIQDVYFRVNRQNIIVMASPSALKMFGFASITDLIGKPVSTLWKYPDKRAAFLDALKLEGGAIQDWEAEFLRKDGTGFWVSVTAQLRRDDNGEYDGTEGIMRDISERKKTESALRNAIKKLNMLSSITRHDILNQVTGLRTFLELSREDLRGTKYEAYIRKEDQAAEAIQRQIEFTKYYQDIGVNEPKWQDAGTVIRDALGQLNPQSVTVRIDISGLEIFADPLIVKVFFNLMENSLRHGERVTTMSFSCREPENGVIIEYRDNGVGISAADKERLFRRGFGKHTGLGLFLSREILAITGITITENGQPGQGVCFEIAIPPEGARFTR